MNETIAKITNLDKYFLDEKSLKLNSINAELPKGKIIGLVGPDGAGKTTLIRIMAGLLKPSRGFVTILGNDTIKDVKKVHDLISYMPQKFGLYEDLTVEQNLNLYADIYNLTQDEKREKYEKLLRFTNLKPFLDRLAGNLSGGMKQKLGLACTLLRKPSLLLLDEPSVGVDPLSRRELWSMVKELCLEDISVVWSTSYLDEAEKCEEVLLLNEGKLLYYGVPGKLTQNVAGRTFQIQNISSDKRIVLRKALTDENVVDGILQSDFVRLVLKKGAQNFSIEPFQAGKEAILKETTPRFEDAFMDVLGGSSKKSSPLLEHKLKIEKNGKPIIEVKSLTKRFNNFTAVNNINFSVKRGEIFGLLGPNGAGKSTTFKMLCGLLKPTEGDAFISGLSIKTVSSKAREKIGYMAQKFSLYGSMTVKQNLDFFSGIYPTDIKVKAEIVNNMIDMFDLRQYKNTEALLLPLGFKQRLSLSCAIMHDPEVLFLDEPTSGVDPVTRREFWNHINAMVEKGVSIVITTHFMDEAEYCDRIGLINGGRLIVIGTPDELKQSVKSDEIKEPTLEDAFIKLSEKIR